MNIINNEKLLAGYFLAGYPNKEECLNILEALQEEGIDIFEIGFPSMDPYLDGEVIKEAHEKIIIDKGNYDIGFWEDLRKRVKKPIWVMAYKKDFIDTNIYQTLSSKKLIDGLVLPDCSLEEKIQIFNEVKSYGVEVLGFINTSMTKVELNKTLDIFPFIYFQLYVGTTGNNTEVNDDYLGLLEEVKKEHENCLLAGFGISTPERVKILADQGFDGVIVGTALISNLQSSKKELFDLIRKMKNNLIGRDD